VRYAYRDARRYAALGGHRLRGTEKIWDTSLVHIAFGWLCAHADDKGQMRFLDAVYPPFWCRELDVEDHAVVEGLLRSVGAPTDGFATWAAGPGRARHDAEQRAIFDAGIYGVPTYVLTRGPAVGRWFFGREHLPTVAWLLAGGRGEAPDVAYQSFGYASRGAAVSHAGDAEQSANDAGPEAPMASFICCIDVRQPESYLALDPIWRLADELDVTPAWLPFAAPPRRPPPLAAPGDDRGTRHRRHRALAEERELRHYAGLQGLKLDDWYRSPDPAVMEASLLALRDARSNDRQGWRDALHALFVGYWEEGLDLTDAAAVAECLELAPAAIDAQRGPAEETRNALMDRGVFTAPTLMVADELFVGRAHLPLLRWYLQGRRGSPPV